MLKKYEKFSFKGKLEKDKKRIIFKSFKKEINKNILPINSSLSLPAIRKEEKRKRPFELNNYNNKKGNIIIKRKNYLTPSFKDSIRHINNNFLLNKDPKETIYNNKLIANSYNILNIKNEDHIKDLLNFGNRENLYSYIGKKGYNVYNNPFANFMNKNFSKMIKEKISNDDSSEYYINNAWSVLEYAFKEEPNLKFRKNMEDKSKSIDGFNNSNDNSFFCIFDGHGGNEVSTYLQKNIINYMRQYFPNFDLLFQKLDDNFLNENFAQVGSTGCIIYITKEYSINKSKKILYCVNIGDTRAILINKTGYKRLSYDDRADDKYEMERVKKSGGIIFGGRVFGNLMLTRAFGDYEFKKYGIICNPHITKYEIDFDDKYIVMASDGVWDALNENEIFIMSQECKNTKELCDIIVRKSLDKSMDNISCFVIKLN